MWTIKEEKKGQVLLSDSVDEKWVWKEDIEKIMHYESFRQYFMSLDMELPNM